MVFIFESVPPQHTHTHTHTVRAIMSICAISSSLFLIPAVVAWFALKQKDVAVACMVCFVTSVCNHIYQGQNEVLRTLDVWVVRGIALMYTVHCIVTMGVKMWALAMYACGVLTLAWYIYLRIRAQVDYNWHCMVHVFAVLGIMCYIIARREYLGY